MRLYMGLAKKIECILRIFNLYARFAVSVINGRS